MANINQVKQQIVTDTPLLLFECVMPSGNVENWSSHGVFFEDTYFEARVLRHDLFDLQLSADDATDGISRLTLVLANADSALSELNSVPVFNGLQGINGSQGFKGSQLTVYFAFADLSSLRTTTERTILFRGIAGDPDEISEDSFTLSFVNKLNLQRIPLPEVRIQRTCSWNFPASSAQRQDASGSGAKGFFSPFFRCGYSPDAVQGAGNLDSVGNPFTSCDKSRAQCKERGMFDQDEKSQITRRFSGFDFVPSAISVRTAGDKASHLSAVLSNSAKYNDPVPIIYGTSWLKAPIIFARNDGNLTHMEVLLGMGPISGVLKVVVNDVEVPLASPGQDLTATGWYNVYAQGLRSGSFNLDFLDDAGKPLGDPYGSMASMSVVVPNRISTGSSLPTVQVLLQGVRMDTFDLSGTMEENRFTNNPAWIMLDILRRCGWSLAELDLSSFKHSADYCGELISGKDLNGKTVPVQRFQCNLSITKRQSAANILRGVRVASSLMLRYSADGLLEVVPETSLAQQQNAAPDGTNSDQPLYGGWPAYEFSDDSAAFSGIVRSESGASTVRLLSRSIAEVSNRLSVEFQDEENEFQQDSLSVVDSGDSSLIGYEIASQSAALGIANYNQATRVLLRQLDKNIKGNVFVEFQTSFRALKVRPGDVITLTYLKEGFDRTPFRVVKLSPSMNYQLVTITAQIHNDDWYSDNIDVLSGAGRQPGAGVGVPRPLIGTQREPSSGRFDRFDFGVSEEVQALADGTATDLLTVSFSQPSKPSRNAPRVPLVSLAPEIQDVGGSLDGQKTYYYAVSALDVNQQEGPLSFTIKATIDGIGSAFAVRLKDLSFPANASGFNVYRGETPQLLLRIASNNPVADSFTDLGSDPQPYGPPDANFDHANFYYRYEVVSASIVSSASPKTLVCNSLGATIGTYSGMLVRIDNGTGKGQERSIATNDAMTLTLTSAWSVIPDGTSTFVICEPSWRFAGVTSFSPIQFSVPYRAGSVLQVTGRAANVHNQEGTPELCPLVRVPLGDKKPDFGVPATPSFLLSAPGSGQLTISEIGFTSDDNIASISSGTLNLFYWNETGTAFSSTLQGQIGPITPLLQLNSALDLANGRFLQIGTEIVYVLSEIASLPNSYLVTRGRLGSSADSWQAAKEVIQLQNGKLVVPFAANFFQNRASVNLIHAFNLPDVRVVAAQFFVENGFGTSQAAEVCLTKDESSLRTLSGGQFNLQVTGFLASQIAATPPVVVQATHAIRDIRAVLGQPSLGIDVRIDVFQDALPLCSLHIPAEKATSELVNGNNLAALRQDSTLTTNISAVASNGTGIIRPAKDLTVTIRM